MSQDWERQKSLFLAALEANRHDRTHLLQGASPEDRHEVESLLAAHGVVDAVVHTGLLEAITGAAHKGRRVGPWALELPLGLGPLGHTFRARHRDGSIALVQLVEGDGDREQLTTSLEPLARRLLNLDHPNLARVLDVGREHGALWVATEELGGLPLDRGCDAERVALSGRASLLAELADALEALHQRGILHRDLSTRTARLVDHHVRLGDFGVAGLISEALPRATTAASAPELTAGPPTVATDLFAFGTVAFTVLVGRPPLPGSPPERPSEAARGFDTPTRAALADARQLAPDQLTPALARFDDLVAACLDPQPTGRPASAAAVAARLREL